MRAHCLGAHAYLALISRSRPPPEQLAEFDVARCYCFTYTLWKAVLLSPLLCSRFRSGRSVGSMHRLSTWLHVTLPQQLLCIVSTTLQGFSLQQVLASYRCLPHSSYGLTTSSPLIFAMFLAAFYVNFKLLY